MSAAPSPPLHTARVPIAALLPSGGARPPCVCPEVQEQAPRPDAVDMGRF